MLYIILVLILIASFGFLADAVHKTRRRRP